MKKLLFAFVLLCLFCTCKKDPYANLCGGNDPINNLPWLKTMIDILQKYKSSYPIIYRFNYKNTTLFCEGSTCTNCSWSPGFYDCNGNELKTNQDQSNKFMDVIASKREIIWNSRN
ncbi:MAG: hypothetical protein ACRYGB_09530 [Janthinobacterium lividum]